MSGHDLFVSELDSKAPPLIPRELYGPVQETYVTVYRTMIISRVTYPRDCGCTDLVFPGQNR